MLELLFLHRKYSHYSLLFCSVALRTITDDETESPTEDDEGIIQTSSAPNIQCPVLRLSL